MINFASSPGKYCASSYYFYSDVVDGAAGHMTGDSASKTPS